MMVVMEEFKREPGLVQVFRWYVILRGVFFIVMPAIYFLFDHRRFVFGLSELALLAAFLVLNVLIPGVYAFSSRAQSLFGRAYVLVGVTYAAFGLILEQHYVSAWRGFWQPIPFMFILLIFVAWQYRYPYVIVFTLGVVLFDIALMEISPPPHVPKFVPSDREISILYGRMLTSTISYLVLGYVVNRLIEAQRAQRRQLAEANLKLVQHAATVEQLSTSRERNRLSRELHDTLAHTLSALAVQFDALATVWESIPDKGRQLIEQMQATTRTGLDETRRALRALRASPLEDMGLILAIQEMAQDLAERSSLALKLNLPDNLDDIPPEVEQCYYRVAQEAFENVVRHAQADSLAVTLSQDSSGLLMIIADDGRGLDLQEDIEADHLGIQGILERARMIGADLEVDSKPGEGTTIRLYLEKGA